MTTNAKKSLDLSIPGLVSLLVDKDRSITEEIDDLQELLSRVCSTHAMKHPELLRIQSLFRGLNQILTIHIIKEEKSLFPHILRLEEEVRKNQFAFYPVVLGNPIKVLIEEHDTQRELLRRIREESSGFTTPEDADERYRELYSRLSAFEQDLRRHMDLEENLLYPRTLEMESMV